MDIYSRITSISRADVTQFVCDTAKKFPLSRDEVLATIKISAYSFDFLDKATLTPSRVGAIICAYPTFALISRQFLGNTENKGLIDRLVDEEGALTLIAALTCSNGKNAFKFTVVGTLVNILDSCLQYYAASLEKNGTVNSEKLETFTEISLGSRFRRGAMKALMVSIAVTSTRVFRFDFALKIAMLTGAIAFIAEIQKTHDRNKSVVSPRSKTDVLNILTTVSVCYLLLLRNSNGKEFVRAIKSCVIAPIAEEILFRDFIQERAEDLMHLFSRHIYHLKEETIQSVSNYAQATLFGLAHIINSNSDFYGKTFRVLTTGIAGLSYGEIKQVKGSLVPSMQVHALNNATLLIIDALICG